MEVQDADGVGGARLVGSDKWEVASGEIKMEEMTTALDQASFKRKSRKALAIICLALEDS